MSQNYIRKIDKNIIKQRKKYTKQYANFDTVQNQLKKYGFKMDLEILINNNNK